MTLEFYETKLSIDWDTAKFYCFALNVDGRIGWRLPTEAEFREFRSFTGIHWYWSSEERGDRHAKSLYPFPDLVERGTDLKSCKWSVLAVRDV